jgi:UDP-glucose 4-epimerase
MASTRIHNVLITGATGALGPRVVQAFLDAGHHVRTFSLHEPEAHSLPDSVDARLGDVTDAQAVASALQGIETLVHLAALLHIVDPPPEIQERYQRVNVSGTGTLVEEALKAGVRRVVLFSTIAVYGAGSGQILNEDSGPQPVTPYARSKLEAERIVLSTKRADGQPIGTVLRMGAIYGSRVKGNYRRLVRALARGWFLPLGSGENRRTLIYEKDAAQAAVLAASHSAAAGQVFNVSDGEFHTMNEIIATICEALGRKPPRISIPVGPVTMAAGLLEGAARAVGRKSPLIRATIEKYTEDIAVDSHKIRAELGFAPEYSLGEGWREAIREMREKGEL